MTSTRKLGLHASRSLLYSFALAPLVSLSQSSDGVLSYSVFTTSIPAMGSVGLAVLTVSLLLVAKRHWRLHKGLAGLAILAITGAVILSKPNDLLAIVLNSISLQAPPVGGVATVGIGDGVLNSYSNDAGAVLQVSAIALPASCPNSLASNRCESGGRISLGSECIIDCRPIGQPPDPGTSVTLNFFVDDSANRTYEADDGLAYRGSFSFDSTTRNLVFDGAFSGPYPLLFDDGPLSGGGNEPEGAVAGDNVWSATAFVDTSAAVALEYFAIRGSDGNSVGQFIWDRPNGILNFTAGQTGTVNAAGLIIPAFGDQDMLVTVDVSGNGANLSELFRDVDYTDAVRIRLNALSGPLLEDSLVMRDDGTGGDAVANDGIYSFLLSENFGKHDGLLVTGSTVRFVLELAGNFYIAGDLAQSAGVTLAFNAVLAGFVANGDRLEATVP